MKKILVLIPSLNRPHELNEALSSFIVHGTGLADYLTIGGPGGYIKAVNSVPHKLLSQYEIIGLMSDDIRMRTPSWDLIVVNQLQGKIGMVWGRDGIKDDRLSTHPFVSTRVFSEIGFIVPHELSHFYGDDFLMELLVPLGRAEYLPDLYTEHLHYTVGKRAADASDGNGDQRWAHDIPVWNEIKNFRLPSYREHLSKALA